MKKIVSISQTRRLAERLAKIIIKKTKNRQRATVVAMTGDLGSGKTTFIQFFAKALGIKEKITSPTFVILKKFKIQNSKFKTLVHVDVYRIENPKEILDLEWKKMSENPENIILVEWAEKIKEILPKDAIFIKLRHIDENKRQIEIEANKSFWPLKIV